MFPFTITVHAWEHVLERRPGRPTRALDAGRRLRRFGADYHRVDARRQLHLVPSQEVLTADGVSVKAAAAIVWHVAEPVSFSEATTDAFAVVYLAVQVGLREALVSYDVERLLGEGRTVINESVTQVARAAGPAVGVEVHEVVLKDVVLPMELRSAYAAVVVGRQRAIAQLEAARAETAALRSLANGAKLLDDHPAMARQRLVQALPMGSTVELSAGG